MKEKRSERKRLRMVGKEGGGKDNNLPQYQV
jgi:hypothetical protein